MAQVLEPAPDHLEGTTLAGGTYRLERFLGKVPLGRLYQARQVPFERPVYLRLLHGSHLHDEQLVARFQQAGFAAGLIQHRNVEHVADLGQEADGSLYLVTEHLEGCTLRQLVSDEAPLPTARIIDLVGQIAAGLTAAHAVGVIHRDLRPDAVLIAGEETDDGDPIEVVKLTSFGAARVLEESGGASAPLVEMVQGDPGFMSPEQCNGSPMDGRSDLYATGCLAYYLATGQPPFIGDPMDVLTQHVVEPATPPSQLNPDVPPALEAVILKCLAKAPVDRYQSARRLRLALKQVRMAPPAPRPGKGPTPTLGSVPPGPPSVPPPTPPLPPPPPMPSTGLRGERAKPTLVLDRAQLVQSLAPPPRKKATTLLIAAVVAAVVLGIVGGLLAGQIFSSDAPPEDAPHTAE